MKRHILSLVSLGTLVLCLGFLLSCNAQTVSTAGKAPATTETTVYIVRHAEKAPSSGAMTDDPSLSEAGKARAKALSAQLRPVSVKGLYATKYKRTQETLQPLSQSKNVPVQLYDAMDYAGLIGKIKEAYTGQTVVVAGHSNTVLALIEAFGVQKPVSEVADYQYDYLFKLTLSEGQPTMLQVLKYGEPSKAPQK